MAATELSATAEPSAGAERTAEPASPPRPSRLTRLKEHARDPMSRSGYALVLGSAITSALGMAFWVLAARLYDARDVGMASSMIAAMGFLGTGSTIGLKNGFIRFLPVAGSSALRFIRNGYLGCVTVAVVASLIFVAGQPIWAGELSMLREGPAQIAFFAVATAAWTVFVLQDSVLTGLRMASWVPAENAVFAVSKLALLVGLVSMPRWGIFVAWSVPAIVLLVPVNALIIRHVRKRRAASSTSESIAIGDVIRFAAGDHAAAFLWLGTTELLSLVVLAQAGPEDAAFYFLSFQIAYALYLVTSNVASAFVVEAAVHPDQERSLLRRALLQSARLVVPGALIAAAAAPWLLRVIGSEYEKFAVPLLRLLLLSAIPQILVGMAVGRARLHRHVRIVILVYLFTAISLFSGATFGLRAGGLEAVGWVWLATQTLVALVLTPTVLEPAIGRWVVNRIVRAGSWLLTGAHQRGRTRSARRLLPPALRAAGADDPAKFTVLRSHHDVIVARSMFDGDPGVMRVAMSDAGRDAVTDNAEMIERLAGDRRLARWGSIVPSLLHLEVVEGHTVAVETFLAGTPLDQLSGDEREAGVARAIGSIRTLHNATSRPARFDDSVARRWIDEPLEAVSSLAAVADRSEDVARLRSWLRAELLGRDVELCWVHGDFWSGNVLIGGKTEAHPRVTGIFDWENGRLDGIAAVDLAHLWLTEQSGELGDVVERALEDPASWPQTRTLDDGTILDSASQLPARAVLVLAWLGHVAAGVARSSDRPPSRVWIRRNVLAVLDRSADLVASPPVDRTAAPGTAEPETEPETSEPEPTETEPTETDDDVADDGDLDEADTDPDGAAALAAEAESEPESEPDAAPATVRRRRLRLERADLASIVVLLGAVAAWVAGMWGADPRTMTDLGLVSLLTPAMVCGLVVLTAGFVWALRREAPGWLLGLHIVALLALLHGTPAVLYETLRYSWAWKHTGIVEFITRTGSVDTTVEVTPIYHSWPGFFAASALLTDLVGARHSARIAMWAPLAFNLANLMALRFLLRSLTGSHRLLWLGTWFFFITNWVGQDYFSPQAMAYLLYLVVIGVALRGFRHHRPRVPAFAEPMSPKAALVILTALLFAIASSHQITPFLAAVVLAGLVLLRQIRGWYLPVIAGVLMGGWALTVGQGELSKNAQSLIDSFGQPISNAEETFEKTSGISASQLLVSQAGRLVVAALTVLALVGLVRMWRRGTLDRAVLVIAATPMALPFATEFGGEAIFRVFLFAVPAMALLAAGALDPGRGPGDTHQPDGRTGAPWGIVRTLACFVLSAGLLLGYTVAYYGKDQRYYFTQGEIDAMTWVADHAQPGSLLVEGSRNYPSQFLNYEFFTYVAIAREPEESRERILRDPARRMEHWLDNPEYADAFLLITRSQKIDVDLSGPLPVGSISRIEGLLRESDRFEVAFENDDAVVFQLADPRRRSTG